jgi:hypothetical protein
VRGKYAAAEFIDKAMTDGSAWTEYRPGFNTPARKETYVRKVQYGAETYVVGAGFYVTEHEANSETSWPLSATARRARREARLLRSWHCRCILQETDRLMWSSGNHMPASE